MPLPTAPSKLGNLLPPDEYKAKATPARSAKKQASEGEQAESADEHTKLHERNRRDACIKEDTREVAIKAK